VPIALDGRAGLLASGKLPIDVALLQVSPPDRRGFVSLGVSVEPRAAVLRVARALLRGQPAMPALWRELRPLDRFDAFVSVDTP